MGADFNDAQTTYNSTTGEWELSIASSGGEWVSRFLDFPFPGFEGRRQHLHLRWRDVRYPRRMDEGRNDSLHGLAPDLTTFHENGVRSPPVRPSNYESVRQTMYPGKSYNASNNELKEWYRLFLVPGAAHCASNSAQPNGPFPQTNLHVMTRWVEQGIVPHTLNATVLQGDNKGANEQVCAWPLCPYWKGSGKTLTCEYDQASIDTFTYTFDAYKTPLY
ncbi:unnamed protein product [Penicillium palitans]